MRATWQSTAFDRRRRRSLNCWLSTDCSRVLARAACCSPLAPHFNDRRFLSGVGTWTREKQKMYTWPLALIASFAIVCVATSLELEADENAAYDAMRAFKRRPMAELLGKRAAAVDDAGKTSVGRDERSAIFELADVAVSSAADAAEYARRARSTRELFGKRAVDTQKRARELFGKRSAPSSMALSDEQLDLLAQFMTERQRRARGGELFG